MTKGIRGKSAADLKRQKKSMEKRTKSIDKELKRRK